MMQRVAFLLRLRPGTEEAMTEAAKREIALYFKPEEICDFEPTITPWLRAAVGYMPVGYESAIVGDIEACTRMQQLTRWIKNAD